MNIRVRHCALGLLSTVIGVAATNVGAIANAALVTKVFEVEITNGDLFLGETFSGEFVYDDAFLTSSGFEVLSIGSGLESLEFTYVGADLTTPVVYAASDDIGFPGFPQLGFTDGALDGLIDGLLYEVEVGSDLAFFFQGKFFGTDQFSTGSFNDGVVTYSDPTPVPEAVPEPISCIGLGLFAAYGALNLRNRKQKSGLNLG